MGTISKFAARTATRQAEADQADQITVEEMAVICPLCVEKMQAKGLKSISARRMIEGMLAERRQAQGGGPGNIDELIKHWRKQEHPFSACRSWVEEHRGEKDYPDIKDVDAFCGKIKHLTED